ncbi:hypothetical protein VNI00_012979 [Paramarasmius palmivorus]|uniref:Uncharacterized protein n=1 Tax=Paramarasmius palmivorus TaxID=297713 RepID=A0AAW0C2Q9_9AGAR
MMPSSESTTDDGPLPLRLVKSIFDHADRIRHLSLQFVGQGEGAAFASGFPPFRGRFVSLTHLLIEIYQSGHEVHDLLNAFSTSPLCSIELYNATATSSAIFPYSRLSNIGIDDGDFSLFTDILSKARSLEHARFVLRKNTGLPNDISIQPIAKLRSLEIDMHVGLAYSRDYIRLFNLLSCPALTSLTFSMFPERSKVFVHTFVGFIKRCPKIQSFTLGATEFEDEDLLMILAQMPELVFLDVLLPYGVTSRFMQELGSARIVPKLKDLRGDIFSKRFDWNAFVDMVDCRWAMPNRSLRSVYWISDHVRVPESVLPWVRKLQREGLAIRIYVEMDLQDDEYFAYEVQG